MSDLISRKKVISILEQLEEHSLSGKMDISNAIYLLEKQPTAYDINKVVEQLWDASFERFGCDTGMGGELVVNMDDVIEIVKAGGNADLLIDKAKSKSGERIPYDGKWK